MLKKFDLKQWCRSGL